MSTVAAEMVNLQLTRDGALEIAHLLAVVMAAGTREDALNAAEWRGALLQWANDQEG